METWPEVASKNLEAAKLLLQAGQHRSATSRAYYGAFAAITGFLSDNNMRFPIGREGPSHGKLPGLLAGVMSPSPKRKLIVQSTRALYEARLHADYRTRNFGREEALDAVRRADVLIRELERI